MADPQPSRARGRLLPIVAIIGAGVVAAFQVGKAPVALPLLRADLDLTLTQAAWILSLFAVLGACSSLAVGLVAPKLGARRALVAALGLIALASLLGSFASSFAALIATRVAEGAGFVLIATVAPPLLAGLARERNRDAILAVWGVYMPLGMSLVAAFSIGIGVIGWRAVWVGNGLLAALWCALCLAVVPADALREPLNGTALRRDIRAVISSGPACRLVVAFLIYAVIYFAFVGFLPTMLLERYSVPLPWVALASAAIAFCNALGNLGASLLLRAGHPIWLVIAAAFAVISLPPLLIFSSGAPLPVVLAASGLLIGLAGLIPASTMAAAGRLAPRPALVGAMVGFAMQGSTVGQLVGPAAFAWWSERLGWESGSVFLLPLTLAGALLALSLRSALTAR